MRDNKESITKELLEFLLITGGITLLLTNPAFLAPAILIAKYGGASAHKKKVSSSISYLKNKKYVSLTKNKGGRFHLKLTTKGKEKAVLYSLQSTLTTKLSNHKKWDKKWRLVIFDIETSRRDKRDALRRMLKRSGFVLLQKSTWIYPFDCKEEVSITKDFFDIKDSECRFVLATDIGDDTALKKIFKIL
ncbi:MAG: hypothetical protein WD509_00555 [Candidatus Paceibacterota bacterium]